MTRIRYLSLRQYTDGSREGATFVAYGRGAKTGHERVFGTRTNDIDGVEKHPWERIDVVELPRVMRKVEVVQWLEKRDLEDVFDAPAEVVR